MARQPRASLKWYRKLFTQIFRDRDDSDDHPNETPDDDQVPPGYVSLMAADETTWLTDINGAFLIGKL